MMFNEVSSPYSEVIEVCGEIGVNPAHVAMAEDMGRETTRLTLIVDEYRGPAQRCVFGYLPDVMAKLNGAE